MNKCFVPSILLIWSCLQGLSCAQQPVGVFFNPFYYWFNYLSAKPPIKPIKPLDNSTTTNTESGPCVEPYCLDGQIFNEETCKCDPELSDPQYTLDTNLDDTQNITNITCSLDCPRGKYLDSEKCVCKCAYVPVKCIGLTKLNLDTCKCQCTHPYPCKENERFDEIHCVCVPTRPYLPNTQPFNIFRIPTTGIGSPCVPRQCRANQLFSTTTCKCYCPLEDSRYCIGNKVLDPDSCECKCPSALAHLCSGAQYFDHDDCSCKCRVSTTVCNNLQVFNKRTCQCECRRVMVTLPRIKRSIGAESSSEQIHEEQMMTYNAANKISRNKRRTDSGKKARTKSKKTKTKSSSKEETPSQQAIAQPTFRQRNIIMFSCPFGTLVDQNTCTCVNTFFA